MTAGVSKPSLLARWAGHLWTVGPTARYLAVPPVGPAATAWATTLEDPVVGPVRLGGLWSETARRDVALVVVHGLGGDGASAYAVTAAQAAQQAGVSCLRLALRGADRSGEDLYHAGLSADLSAALQSPELAPYRYVVLLGFSLGGHLCLRAALDRIDPRLRAVAAVCPPLDLAAVQRAIDAPWRWLYRRHLLDSLKEIYRAVARRRPVAFPASTVARARSMREYDALAVVPRFGFRDVADYYTRASVGDELGGLTTPALVVAGMRDPMIPPQTLLPSLERASAQLDVRWIDGGGHMYFPADLHLGVDAAAGLEPQVIGWLYQRCGS